MKMKKESSLDVVTTEKALSRLHDDGSIIITTKSRKKKVQVLELDNKSPCLLFEDAKGDFIIPKRMVNRCICRGHLWESIISHDGVQPRIQFIHIDADGTRKPGTVEAKGATALKSAFDLALKETMSPSVDGRAELGIFTEFGQALLAQAFKSQLVDRPDLLEKANTCVALHSIDDDEFNVGKQCKPRRDALPKSMVLKTNKKRRDVMPRQPCLMAKRRRVCLQNQTDMHFVRPELAAQHVVCPELAAEFEATAHYADCMVDLVEYLGLFFTESGGVSQDMAVQETMSYEVFEEYHDDTLILGE